MTGFQSFLVWLADSPLALALKVGLAAAGGWLIANVDSIGLPPIVAVGLVPALVILVNALNPHDPTVGIGKVKV